jgi:hypothetical protein
MTRRKKLDEANDQVSAGQNLEFSQGKPAGLDAGLDAATGDCTDVQETHKCAKTDVSARTQPNAMPGESFPGQFDARGKFARGNTLGRKPRQTVDTAYVDAMRAGMPPDRVVELLDKAIELAIATKSARGVMAAVEFATAYTLGKPKQRTGVQPDRTLADLLAAVDTSKPLMPDENEEEA